MTVPTRVVANAQSAIADLNQLIDLLEGAGGFTETFLLKSTSGQDFIIRLADAAGARKWIIQDSAGTQVASIDSSGNMVLSGSTTLGTLLFPLAATPAQTANGSAVWDSDDFVLTIGTGAVRKTLTPATQGAIIASGATLTITDTNHHVSGTTTVTAISTRQAGYILTLTFDGALTLTHNATTLVMLSAANYTTVAGDTLVFVSEGAGNWRQIVGGSTVFDGIRTQFRANRRLVAEWSAQFNANATNDRQGIGFIVNVVDASDLLTILTGEPVLNMSSATAGAAGVHNNLAAGLSPSHSPRMLARVVLPAASGNLTYFELGFFADLSSTSAGAMVRLVTTGNAFFVTRQGGAETTTDLGALSRTAVLGFEIETVDAGVTWVLRNQAGAQLASHTTNVPTAATGLRYGVYAATATGAVVWKAAYLRVEGTFV